MQHDRIITVYIAGPYSYGDTPLNVADALSVFNHLADLGFTPFCPHLTMFAHMTKPRGYQWWLRYDRVWLEKCDALLRIPGRSKGADMEVDDAKAKGIPVFRSVTELCEHFGRNRPAD